MEKITALIVAKEYPPHLIECIKSIQGWVDEIIIGDIGLNKEALRELSAYEKVKIYNIEFPVPYVELVREYMKKYASHERILVLDPDETLTPQLIEYLNKKTSSYDYVSIPRKNIIFGKWIEHARWWPDYQIRFFNKTNVVWPKEIHQQPNTRGQGHKIDPDSNLAIIHHNYDTVDEYIFKAIRYAKSEAHENHIHNHKYTLNLAFKNAISEFTSRYFADEGYKDTMHGLVLSVLQMIYPLLVYFYYWEENKYKSSDDNLTTESVKSFFDSGSHSVNHWLIEKKLLSPGRRMKSKLANMFMKKLR